MKPTGSLYLHCDPTASHYLKLLLDAVFRNRNYINEISWKRTTAKADYAQGATHFQVRDILFLYRKNNDAANAANTFNQQLFVPYEQNYVASKYVHVDADGRRYQLDNITEQAEPRRATLSMRSWA